jgi:hypothetical protein
MSAHWVQVKDVAAFLRSGRTRKGVHEFTARILHWPYCKHCGLMLIKNDVSRRAASGTCIRLED